MHYSHQLGQPVEKVKTQGIQCLGPALEMLILLSGVNTVALKMNIF